MPKPAKPGPRPSSRQGRAAGGPSARRPPRRAAQSGPGRQAANLRPASLRRSAAGALRGGRRAASARPDRRDRVGRIAEDAARTRRPQHPRPPGVDAAPAAAAGQVGRRSAVQDRLGIRAQGRPAARDRRTGQGNRRSRARPGAARRHRLGQDLHHGQGDRGDAAPGADPRPQQDAGGAALRRVQELLPRQRGRVLRLLLRLLPAGGLRPALRHLYREGIVDQRADRPHAPRRDARGDGARRRHHRRLGLLHLRHRLGRDLHRDDLLACRRRQGRPAPGHRRPRRAAIQAHARPTSAAACSAFAATRSSCSPPTTRTAPGASASSATRSSKSPNSIR